MMSERQIEIKKTARKRDIIEVLAFLGFFTPWFVLWAIHGAPLIPSIEIALGVGIICLVLLFSEWKDIRVKLKRLQRYAVIFDPFFEAMIADMDANDAEKGDTWLTEDMHELMKLIDLKWEELLSSEDEINDELPKLSNYCAMLYLRGLDE